MAYDMSNITNATNIASQYLEVDRASGGVLGALTLISTFVILTMVLLRRAEPAEAVASSSTVTAIFALTLTTMGAVDAMWAWGFGVLWGLSLAALVVKR